jgi:hypothetical protein
MTTATVASSLALMLTACPAAAQGRAKSERATVPVFWLIGQSNANGSTAGFWLANPLLPENRWPKLASQPDLKIWWPGASGQRPDSEAGWESYRTGSLDRVNNSSIFINEGNFGVEASFGSAAVEHFGEPVYVFKYAAVAGLHPQLDESWSKRARRSELYASLLREWGRAKGALEAQGLVPEIRGILWFHGEGDAFAPGGDPQRYAREYDKHLKQLIEDFRRDLRSPKAPFVIVQFHDRHIPREDWRRGEELLREAQAKVQKGVKWTVVHPTDGFAVDPECPGAVHFTAVGTIENGFALFETWRGAFVADEGPKDAKRGNQAQPSPGERRLPRRAAPPAR